MGRTCECTKSRHEHCTRGEFIAAVVLLSFAGRLELGVSSRYAPVMDVCFYSLLAPDVQHSEVVLAEQDRAG